jgi:fido (protein-threonine AMPylation protein)
VTTPLPFTRTPHLVGLVAEAEQLAAMLEATDPGPARASLWTAAALATLRLDGSTIPEAPTREQVRAALQAPVGTTTGADPGGWHRTMRSALDLEDAADEVVWAREFQGVVDAMSADELADRLLRSPVDALAELHRRLTTGLVGPEHAGRPRTTEQAVHDAAVGRVLYFATEPADVPGELHRLGGWLASGAAREHGLVVSGVVHLELLRIHPFEAANGRVARSAARLLLRSRGLDPHGLAVAEIPLAADAIGTYEEVARTARRRDLTIWLERWGEAVTAGLRHAALALGVLTADVPDRAAAFVDARPGGAFTIMDYRGEAGVGPEEARADLAELLDAGRVERVLGSRGLRFRVT